MDFPREEVIRTGAWRRPLEMLRALLSGLHIPQMEVEVQALVLV